MNIPNPAAKGQGPKGTDITALGRVMKGPVNAGPKENTAPSSLPKGDA